MDNDGQRRADAFARIMSEHGLRANAWHRGGDHRVYFPGSQYVSIGRDGTVALFCRGRATLVTSSFYPSQRRSWSAGMTAYSAWLHVDVADAWAALEAADGTP